MNIKLTALTAGVLAVISATANAQPPAAPGQYNAGPQAPLLNTTNLSAAERSAFALYEGVLKVTEAKIHATSCAAATFNIGVYADGSTGSNASPLPNPNAIFNQVKVTGSGGSGAPQFELNANLSTPVAGRGQQVLVSLNNPAASSLGSSKITQFNATYAFNNVNNMLVTNNLTIGIVGINGSSSIPDVYTGNLIKDFYHGSTDPAVADYYNIYDWGLQSISKLGYPVNKWWQRSITHRDDGVVGRTVWVKDRLVGASSCRVVIDTNGYNNQSIFWQGGTIGSGTLTIAPVAPSAPISLDSAGKDVWDQVPFK